jgi:predicted GNAT family acetyltransferase
MQVVHQQDRQRFEIALPDGALAIADYRLEGGTIVFPHTVVPRAHEGKGVGSALARASLEWARAQGLRVVPACSFYRTYMQRHPDTHDLLDASGAAQLSR